MPNAFNMGRGGRVGQEDEADKVAVEDVVNARHLQTTFRTKRKVEVDVVTTGVSRLHQEGQE